MKKFYLSLLLTGLMAGLAFSAPSKGFKTSFEPLSGQEMKVGFDLDDYRIGTVVRDGVTYSKIFYSGGVPVEKKGFAEVPVLSATVQLGEKNDVNIVSAEGDYTDIQLDYPLLPSRGTIYRNQDPSKIPYEIDNESIKDEWYPTNTAYNTDPFVYRDTRGVNIYVHPFRYNAVTKTLRVYKNMSVGLKEDPTKTTNPLTVRPSRVDASMSDSYRSLYVNYEESKFTNQVGQYGEMLVIYTSRDATVIQPYIDWKREKGFQVTATEVSTGTNVKTTVSNAYSSNPNILYVQLVGDWADIKCDLGPDNAPTDPMLGCVVGTDLYPELIVGRFSGDSTGDITVQVDKAINYEKNPNTGSYYTNNTGVNSTEGSGIGDDDEADDVHIGNIINNKLLPYNYADYAQYTYDGANTTMRSQITADLNGTGSLGGVGLYNYCGHGTKTTWYSTGFSNTDIGNLSNGNMLPFIWSVACVNGEFHTTGDCFAEAWLNKSGGGAVATLMATINQPWVPPMVGQDYFNDILIGGYDYNSNPGGGTSTTSSDKRTTFGSISVNGMVLMLAENSGDGTFQDTMETWTLFGDASLQVRTLSPLALNSSNTTVEEGVAYSTTITQGGSAFANAMVSLCYNGNTYSGLTDGSGNVSVSHPFTSGQNVTLTVTGYNLLTQQSVVTVTGENPPNAPVLVSPADGSSSYDFTPTFDWEDISNADYFTIEVDNNSNFSSPEIDQSPTVSEYTPGSDLAEGTYYWRVNATNTYGTSSYSSVYSVTLTTPPDITLPPSLNASTAPETTTQNTFDIGNVGGDDLSYSGAFEYTSWPGMKADITVHSNNFDSGLGNYTNTGVDLNFVATGGAAVLTEGNGNAVKEGQLTSDTFDGTVCTDLYLQFTQNFATGGGSNIVAEYYNGSAWTSVYTANSSTTASQNIAIPNTATQIRFTGNILGRSDDSWSIDNVVVSGPENITYDWLRLNTAETINGTVTGSNSETITVDYDATGCPEGFYEADITVTSNDPDESSLVIPVDFNVTAGTLNPPANTTTVTATDTTCDLSWDAVSGATVYYIYRSTLPYSGFALYDTTTSTTWQDTDVSAGKKYFYYITADNAKK